MAFHHAALELPTDKKTQCVNLTQRVRAEVKASGVENGLCTVFVPHVTAAVTINENTDPDVQTDILNALERAVPKTAQYYKHEEGNAHAHAKASVIGASQTIPVVNGKLMLGTWQAIFFCEFDGPRNRKVLVTVVG
ncbi:MAG TPA: secondary thiamine-phosphate synthase enzyme YjbQ [Solirubrobacterales bacterium]|nr:secondary thiamine-phosphate synthase enzyme YjbQ [Solirubrobacterales bacterium]